MRDSFDRESRRLVALANECNVTLSDCIDIIMALKMDRANLPIPERVHLKLVEFYCLSSGHIQEQMHRLRLGRRSLLAPNIALQSSKFSITASDFSSIIERVVRHGYAVLPFSLTQQEAIRLLERSHSFFYRNCLLDDGSRTHASSLAEVNTSTTSGKRISTAHADEESILADEEFRSLICDPVILSLVSFLLGGEAILRHVSCWHSFPSSRPNSEAAQLFHFDLDEFKWLKLFIFLTDVESNSGPHVYIPASHLPGTKPRELLRHGYARIFDEEIEKYYPRHTWKTLLCKKGTMVLADTRCWHKGTQVLSGVRSVLQPEYSLSTFSKSLF